MAEISVGDVVARLRVDASDWQRGLQAAQQALQQFAQSKDAIIANMQRLQQQGQTVGQTFQQFNQQIARTQQQFSQSNQTFQQTNQALTQMNQTVGTTTTAFNHASQAGAGAASAWQGILQVAAGIGLATSIQAIVSSMVEFARSTVQVGVQMQTLRASLTAITGSLQASQEAFRFIVQVSNDTGQSLQTMAAGYRSLSAATRGTALEGQDTQRLLVALSNASRAFGLTTEQTGRLLTGFQQVISKGKVEQEELRQQIGEALPNALQIAARGFGVTTEQLNTMISRGMDATTFVRTFTRQLESELPQGARGAETAAQAFNRLGNEILLLKDRAASSGFLQWLTDVAGGIATIAEQWRKAQEARERYLGQQAQQAAGGPVLEKDRAAIADLVAQLEQAREQLRAFREMQSQGVQGLGGFPIQRQIEDTQRLVDNLQRQIEALRPSAQLRARAEAGIAARRDIEGGGEDRLRAEQDRERDIAAGEARITAIVDRQRVQLEQLRVTPFLTELERSEEVLKVITETTKQLRDLMQTMPAAVQQGMAAPGAAARPYEDLIRRLALERGINPALAMSLVQQESGFDPRARSGAGAMGLLQLMPGTAGQYGLTGGTAANRQALTGVYEPEANLKAGLDYLASLIRQFGGDVNRALTAYNAGPGHGGIPLATGENATFAQEVLARVPRFAGGAGSGATGAMAEQLRLQQAAQAAVEQQQPDLEARRRVFEQGREDLKRYDDAIKQAEQDQQHYQEAIDKVTMTLARQREQAVATLDSLVSKYQESTEARDADAVATLRQQFAGDELLTNYAEQVAQIIAVRDAYNAEVQALQDDFVAIKQRTEAQREAERQQQQFLESLEDTNERLRTPRQQGFPIFTQSVDEELTALNARQQRRTGQFLFQDDEGRARARSLLEQQRQLERLNYAAQLFEDVGTSVGNAWTNALTSIASGTATVSEAFRAMAQSILQSLAQIAAQEGFRALVGFGIRMILGAGTGAVGGGATGFGGEAAGGGGFLAGATGGGGSPIGATSSGALGGVALFQHGGQINQPTFAMLGENPAMNPETVLNRPQMESLLSRAPSAGGQAAGGISIINVSSPEAANQERLKQEALGRQVVVNHVLAELGSGEGSKINRAIRNLQR